MTRMAGLLAEQASEGETSARHERGERPRHSARLAPSEAGRGPVRQPAPAASRSAPAVAASAGNANSIDSSDVVTSTAVPKVANVAENDRSRPSGARNRIRDPRICPAATPADV